MDHRVIPLAMIMAFGFVDCTRVCNDDYRRYEIAFQRPLAIAIDEVDEVEFETCLNDRCSTAQPREGVLDEDTSVEGLEGVVRESAQGLYFDGRLFLGESTGTTRVRVRASKDQKTLFVVDERIDWSPDDDPCHTRPDRLSL